MRMLVDRSVATYRAGRRKVVDINCINGYFRYFWQNSLVFPLLFIANYTAANPSQYCLTAARTASASTGVPLAVLVAVAQTETGRRYAGETQPWPWTVNVAGRGHFFDDASAALTFVRSAHGNGARNMDIGCFQINLRWHGEHFSSFEEMLDPTVNAVYAAGFLSRLHDEMGNWSMAAGAYHSRTPEHALRYRVKFDKFLAAFSGGGAESTPFDRVAVLPNRQIVPRLNNFPLLKSSGGSLAMGSLVPLAAGS